MQCRPRRWARALAGALLAVWVLLLAGHPLLHVHGPRYGQIIADGCPGEAGHHHVDPSRGEDGACAVCLIQQLPREIVLPFRPVVVQFALPAPRLPAAHPRRTTPARRLARAPPSSPARTFV